VSVAISHPSVAPFVQQAARAIFEQGQLDRFFTTVRDDPGNLAQRFLCGAGRLAGRDLRAQFQRRAVTEVPAEKIESHPWGELLRLATGAVDRDGLLTDFVWQRAENAFDRLVARKLHRGLTGVYGFEHSSRLTFERARSLGLRIAYDTPAPEPRFVQSVLEAELERFPELRTRYHSYTAKLEERRIAHRHAEWHCADVVIAASNYTRESFAHSGFDVGKVQVVPYGAPVAMARDHALSGGSPPDAPLTFLWAGTFGVRKGAHYLLEAWRAGNFGRRARLRVFGAVALPDRVLLPLPEGVELNGSVPRADLLAECRKCDALMFPTLCDGFGMVVTEAWSSGLPVITTSCAGAADLLEPGRNGLLVRAGDPDAIAESIAWCLTHRQELRTMREPALATAANWQWSNYRRTLAGALRSAHLFGPAP
jgi:glycosyltransferase involved in cell wall biosynthesis